MQVQVEELRQSEPETIHYFENRISTHIEVITARQHLVAES